ncbi:hypothetical protein [Pseudomonas sp. Pseu.R1]|uniref:hypothetical protein n=1 Tax=Pseudomonas sp. Pseu.R1 TaxID=3379818 RepID=UPI003B936A9B
MPLTRRDILLGGAALGLPWAAEAAVGLSWRGAQWVNLLPQAGAAELALPDAAFDYILERGRWSATADDDTQGESLDAGFVKDLMLAFRDHPQDRNAQLGLGLLALTLGVAQWGIDNPQGLPDDPARSDWKAQTSANTGKHLMSYGVGGVGIAHIDNDELFAFMAYVLNSGLVPTEHKAAFQRLTDRALYPGNDSIYGQLRAAGLCAPMAINVDLEGAPFKHFNNSHNVGYCEKYRNPLLTSLDWQTFRTWIRVALRNKAGQRWLFASWLQTYWEKSLAVVPAGEGMAEELLINVRLRNSLPACADRAAQAVVTDSEGRIRRELDAYAKCAPSAYERRVALMLRSVVLYRHFTGAAPLDLSNASLSSS